MKRLTSRLALLALLGGAGALAAWSVPRVWDVVRYRKEPLLWGEDEVVLLWVTRGVPLDRYLESDHIGEIRSWDLATGYLEMLLEHHLGGWTQTIWIDGEILCQAGVRNETWFSTREPPWHLGKTNRFEPTVPVWLRAWATAELGKPPEQRTTIEALGLQHLEF